MSVFFFVKHIILINKCASAKCVIHVYAGNILINEEYIDCQTVESAIKSENAARNACIDHTPVEELRSQDGKSHIT